METLDCLEARVWWADRFLRYRPRDMLRVIQSAPA